MDIRAVDAKRLLQAAETYCRWPNNAPMRLRGIGPDSRTAKLLGGFDFDLGSIFVACECEGCAQKPALVGNDVKEEESCIMSLLEFAIHCGVVDLIEQQLFDSTNTCGSPGTDIDAVQRAASRTVPDLLFLLDVPYNDAAQVVASVASGPGVKRHPQQQREVDTDGGPSGAGSCMEGVLPLSEFLRQSAEAAGGAALVGRRARVLMFTNFGGISALPDSGSGAAGVSTGEIVDYDVETGMHRIKYDTLQPLGLLRSSEEADDDDDERMDAGCGWIHIAVCHVDLDPKLDSNNATNGTDVDVARSPDASTSEPKAAAAASEKRGLWGSFRGCFKVVPSSVDEHRLNALLRRHLPPPPDNPLRSDAAVGAISTAAPPPPPPPLPALPANDNIVAEGSTADVAIAEAKLGLDMRGAAAWSALEAALPSCATDGECSDRGAVVTGSGPVAAVIEGLTVAMADAAVVNNDGRRGDGRARTLAVSSSMELDASGVTANITDTVAATTLPVAVTEQELNVVEAASGGAMERMMVAEDVAMDVDVRPPRAEGMEVERSGAVTVAVQPQGLADDDGSRGWGAGGADAAEPGTTAAGDAALEAVEVAALSAAVVQDLETHGQTDAAEEPALPRDTAALVRGEEGGDRFYAFLESELITLLERASQLPRPYQPFCEHQHQHQQEQQHRLSVVIREEGDEMAEDCLDPEEEAVALCEEIEALDDVVLRLGLEATVRVKMLLCVWMMRPWQVQFMKEELCARERWGRLTSPRLAVVAMDPSREAPAHSAATVVVV